MKDDKNTSTSDSTDPQKLEGFISEIKDLGYDEKRNELFVKICTIKQNLFQFRSFVEENLNKEELKLTDHGFDKLIANLKSGEPDLDQPDIENQKHYIRLLQENIEGRVASINHMEDMVKKYSLKFEENLQLLLSGVAPSDKLVFPLSNDVMMNNLTKNYDKLSKAFDGISKNQADFTNSLSINTEKQLDMFFHNLLAEYKRLMSKLK
ncbi:hypothetical protein RF11_12328 [Thelohanellus kitauei]|uniref:Uncharacterized protein n=1 Tax=Thelohanellus kitauei TaxID=669202 RepID=A0A0C2JEY1_THEKT|nr:hypothetical protein RF11_12328 [Thelohanellus kitauei]